MDVFAIIISGSMPTWTAFLPVVGIAWAVIAPLIASAISGYLSSKNNSDNREAQQQENAANRLFSEDQDLRHTALQESELDPFRAEMSQGKDLTALDLMGRSNYTPVSVQASGKYAKNVPQISGGFSYNMSPQNRANLAQLYAAVASGRTAPTMTNPLNFGKSSVLNLTGAPPATLDDLTPMSGVPYGANSGALQRGAIPGQTAASPRTPGGAPGAAGVDLSSSVFGGGGSNGANPYGPDDTSNAKYTTDSPYSGGGGGGSFEDLINLINRQKNRKDEQDQQLA